MLYNSFQSTIVTQKSAASLGGIYTQIINVPSLEHPILSIPNCISIASAVFAQLTAESAYTYLQCALKRD